MSLITDNQPVASAMKNHWLLGEPFGSMTRTVAKDGSHREMVAVGPATALAYLANVDTEHHNRKPESVKKQKAACSILIALCNADREAASKYDPRQTEINALIVQELENSYAIAETKKAYEDKKAMGTKIRQKREALQKEVAEGSIIRMDFSKQID